MHLFLIFCESAFRGRRFSPVSSTNKADRYDITEILLKVALNTIIQTKLFQPKKSEQIDSIEFTLKFIIILCTNNALHLYNVMKCTRIGEKRCNCSCFEIYQEMDAILLIIGIV
jgi:hypothetical protein